MDWEDAKELFMVVLIFGMIICLTCRCSYDNGRADERKQLVQELCAKSDYDFCEQVPQKPVYVLKRGK